MFKSEVNRGMGMHLPDKETPNAGKGRYQWKTSQFALNHFWKPQEKEIPGTKKGRGESRSERNKNPGLPWKTGPEKPPVDNYSWRRPIKSDKWTHYWPTVKLVSKWVSKTHYSQGVFSEPLNVHAYTWMGNLGSPRGQGTPLPEWEKTLTSNPPSPAMSLKGVREGGRSRGKTNCREEIFRCTRFHNHNQRIGSYFF